MITFIIGAVCFFGELMFGAFWMAVFSLAKKADKDMEKEMRDVCKKETCFEQSLNFV